MERRLFCQAALLMLLQLVTGCDVGGGGPAPADEDGNRQSPDEVKNVPEDKKANGKRAGEISANEDLKEGNKMSKVAVVVTAARSKGVHQSLEICGLDVYGKNVLVKPNFNTADPAPGSTHNDTLRALAGWLQQHQASHLTLIERSGPPLTRDVMQEKGIYELAKELGMDIINIDELNQSDFVHFSREGLHWKDGFLIPRAIMEAESLVQTCCLKTHAFGGIFTMALKLAVGLVPRRGYKYMSELHGSPHIRKMIAEINAAFTPEITVMDGVDAFVDGGPAVGARKKANVFLASRDRVALDAVGVAMLKKLGSNPAIMDTPVFAQEQIARAAELGLGAASPGEIELVPAEDEASRDCAAALGEILNS